MEQKTDCTDRGQRELEKTLGIEHNPDSQVTGGPIEGFREGWAKMCFQGERAHYYTQVKTDVPAVSKGGRMKAYRSRCGLLHIADNQFPPFHPGSFKKCKRCTQF